MSDKADRSRIGYTSTLFKQETVPRQNSHEPQSSCAFVCSYVRDESSFFGLFTKSQRYVDRELLMDDVEAAWQRTRVNNDVFVDKATLAARSETARLAIDFARAPPWLLSLAPLGLDEWFVTVPAVVFFAILALMTVTSVAWAKHAFRRAVDVRKSVVRVRVSYRMVGSGFALAPAHGVVVTSAHVFLRRAVRDEHGQIIGSENVGLPDESDSTINLEYGDGSIVAEVLCRDFGHRVYIDTVSDVAVVTLHQSDAPLRSSEGLALAPFDTIVRNGDELHVVGYPSRQRRCLTAPVTVEDAVCARQPNVYDAGVHVLKSHGCQVAGMSGAPVFACDDNTRHSDGLVVAMAVQGDDDLDGDKYELPVNAVRDALARLFKCRPWMAHDLRARVDVHVRALATFAHVVHVCVWAVSAGLLYSQCPYFNWQAFAASVAVSICAVEWRRHIRASLEKSIYTT